MRGKSVDRIGIYGLLGRSWRDGNSKILVLRDLVKELGYDCQALEEELDHPEVLCASF